VTTNKLVELIEALGGRFLVENRQVSILWPVSLSPTEHCDFQRLDRMAREDRYRLTAWILEREASRAWEASGRDPHWWREQEGHPREKSAVADKQETAVSADDEQGAPLGSGVRPRNVETPNNDHAGVRLATRNEFVTEEWVSGTVSQSIGGFGFEKPIEGNTNDWLTLPALLKRLGVFDLDPCGCPGMPWSTAKMTYFFPEHDGLTEPWEGRVFCNPPYGGQVGKWARRLAEHGNGIFLVYVRTETEAWQEDIFPFADAILLLARRINFLLPSGEKGSKSPTAPSALLAYGQINVEALRNAGIAGALYTKAEMLPGIEASRL
jgi:hypothetical protein